MLRILLLASAIASVVFVVPVRAEKPSMSVAELQKTATHVVTGQVTAIYQQTEVEGNWKYTRCVAEIRVSQCEKGDGLKPADLVYVRYWHRGWTGKDPVPPSTSGHRGLPAKNEFVRVYLARNAYDGFSDDNNDGGYNVIGADGFEKLKQATGK